MRAAVMLALALLSAAGGAQRQPANVDAVDLVELDVVVVDREDRPVTGLERGDFSVKEDGKTVDLKTFTAVSGAGSDAPPRQLALLLDDSSVPQGGTLVVQAMARAILSRMRTSDEITVVRLNSERDEPFGDLQTAVQRIDDYRGRIVPFQSQDTSERVLRVLGGIARQFQAVESRRKVIVCIGGPNVCNLLEPVPHGSTPLWPLWVDMLSSAARANMAIYAVLPVRPGAIIRFSNGIVDHTGGSGFFNTSKFEAFVDGLWRDAGDYYLLGYWPASSKRDLHSIDVKVARRDVRVRTRRTR